ncbi:MAG: hypothetical protein Q4C53_08950 [Clostridia bacterium]|nr:hypothetical protein [Clostridia bacterium]
MENMQEREENAVVLTEEQMEIIDYLDTTEMEGSAEQIEAFLDFAYQFNITEEMHRQLYKVRPKTADEIWTLLSKVKSGEA